MSFFKEKYAQISEIKKITATLTIKIIFNWEYALFLAQDLALKQ